MGGRRELSELDGHARRYAPSPLFDSTAGRGLAVYRFLALGYAGVIIMMNRDQVVRPVILTLTFAALIAWSLVAPWFPRPSRVALAVETLLVVAGILLTNVVYSEEALAAGVATIPGVWAGAAVMAGALFSGIRGGVIIATIIAIADLIQVAEPNELTRHNIVLLYLLGILIGLAVNLARESQNRLEAALTARERLSERERIARAVHDGVLQSLAYINRRGREIGGASVELADLAAEQERSLRTLVTRYEPAVDRAGDQVDLAATLARHRTDRVDVVLPAGPLEVQAAVATEVDAAVAAALDNVRQHAGADARAWVLLDQDDDELQVIIRDDGVGVAPGRLVEAASEGRIGASGSIRGRLRDVGGDATWSSRPGAGCTVTMRIPHRRESGAPHGVYAQGSGP